MLPTQWRYRLLQSSYTILSQEKESNRTGSVVKDLNDYQGGVWYRAHQDKIVNLEAVTKTVWWLFGVLATQHQWRVEYVE
jgi:hypothetical protein